VFVQFSEIWGIGRTTVHPFIRLGRRGKCRRWFLPSPLFCCTIYQILTAHSSSYMPINCTILHQRLTTIRTLEAELKSELLSTRESGDYDRVRDLRVQIEESVRAVRVDMYTSKFLVQSIDSVMRDLGVSIWYDVLDGMTVQFPSTKTDITSITRILIHKRNRIDILSLWNSNIGPEGAKSITETLKDPNCKLTSLSLGYNNIGLYGTKLIAETLRDPNCKLTSLSLRGNNLGLDGTKLIAETLRDPNCKLTSLNLESNDLGLDGAKHIAETLRDPNCKLTRLDLTFNNLSDDGNATIRSMIAKIKSTGRNIKVELE
jgi:hypothetical protein